MVQWLVTYESFDFGNWLRCYVKKDSELDAEIYVRYHMINKKNRNFKIEVILSRHEYSDYLEILEELQ